MRGGSVAAGVVVVVVIVCVALTSTDLTSSPFPDVLRSRLDFGPGLGMKKSSSLESLQTMVQEV